MVPITAHALQPLASKTTSLPTPVLLAYALFAAVAFIVFHLIADGEFSAVLTLSVIFQCLALVLLCVQSLGSGSAGGISARALVLEAASIACRLSSTLWLNGYLPVDASGDFIYQSVDICSLILVLWLLRRVLVGQRVTYQETEDSLPIGPLMAGSFLLAAVLHSDLDDRPLFDTLWMAGLFMGILAVLPQLWLITRAGGSRVEALTSHYIAAMAVSRLLSGSFMWHAREDIGCEPWIEGFNHAIYAILGAHVLHLLVLGDFAYYYLKAVASGGLACSVDIEGGSAFV